MYREILLNSEDFTRGDRNHPIFTFPEDLRMNYFCIRTAEFPNFYVNIAKDELLGIITFDANGNYLQSKYIIVTQQNFPNVTSIVTFLNSFLSAGTNFTGGPQFTVINTYWIGLSVPFTAPYFSFDFSGKIASGFSGSQLAPTVSLTSLQNVNYVSNYTRRLLGFSENITLTPLIPATVISVTLEGWNAIKETRDNYILLKSNAMSGATFTANTAFTGSYTLSNVIGKIPVNQGTFPYGTYVFYETNDNPIAEGMFSFNGASTGTFDLYFTRASPSMSEDVIDFQGWNFSVTLGIITNESP